MARQGGEKRTVRWLLLQALPGVVAFGASVWWASGAGVWSAVSNCRLLPLLVGLVLHVAAAGTLGFRWRAVLRGIAVHPIPSPWAAAVVSLRAQAAVVLAPAGLAADAMRGYEAGFKKDMAGRLASAALIERVIGAGVLAVVCTIFSLPFLLPAWSTAVTSLGLIGVTVLAVFPVSLRIPGGRLNVRPVLGWTVVNQVLALTGFAAGLQAAGVGASYLALAALASAGAFATMVPVSFNGYGARELVLATLAPCMSLDSKAVVAASLVASTVLLTGLMAASLAARAIPLGYERN